MRHPLTTILKILTLVLPLTVFISSSLAQTEEPDEPLMATFEPGDTVRIGVAADLSNVLPSAGLDVAQAVRLAILDYNDGGGLLGYELETVIEDDLCTDEPAVEVAERLVSDEGLVAVVGHLCSGASIPASEIYNEARVPMISPSSTAGAFTDRGLDVVNRTIFNDNIQGVVAARYIWEVLEAKTMVVLHNETTYGEGLAETVTDTFSELGGTVLTSEGIDPAEEDYSELLEEIAALEPEIIYFGGYQEEAARLVEQMRLGSLPEIPFFSDDGIYGMEFLEGSIEYGEGAYATFGEQQGDPGKIAAFNTAYEMAYGIRPDELGSYHAQAYDAAQMIIRALETAAELDDDGNLVIDREALIDAIRATRRYRGLTGMITCDENGDCAGATISVFQVQDGAWVEIEVPDSVQHGEDE
jgi:branched-chain amino acid transport system substrate-binding protein